MSKQDRIVKAVGPLLEAGENVELAGIVYVGNVSAKRQLATAAATAILTAGMLTATVRPVRRAFALTDRRLLFVDAEGVLHRPKRELLGALPREMVRATRRRSIAVLTAQYDITDREGSGQSIRLTFQMGSWKIGARLAVALNTPSRA